MSPIPRAGLTAVVLVAMSSSMLSAERAPLSPEELERDSTHQVTGKVLAVYQRNESSYLFGAGTLIAQMIVEIRVSQVAKGTGIDPEQIVYVRCWRVQQRGLGFFLPGPSGHFAVPKAGDLVRVWLARGSYRPTGQTDLGLTALYPNGFERLPAAR